MAHKFVGARFIAPAPSDKRLASRVFILQLLPTAFQWGIRPDPGAINRAPTNNRTYISVHAAAQPGSRRLPQGLINCFSQGVHDTDMIRRLIILSLIVLLIFNFSGIMKRFFPIPYQSTIFHYAWQNDIDPYLLSAIIRTESNFDAQAVSHQGARGLMQIMPDTCHWILQQIGGQPIDLEQLYDPDISIMLGSWYVADLSKEFQNNNVLVLAAYNGGRGNVNNWLTEYGFSGNIDEIDKIPYAETRYYVQKALLFHKIYSFLYADG